MARSPSARRTSARPGPRSLTAGAKLDTADLRALFSRWTQFADETARVALVERFLPLARSVARRYMPSGVPLDDLEQVASLGLLKAIDRFEPARGLAFTTFAIPTILGELNHYVRDAGWAVHVPRSAQERARKVEVAVRVLTSQTGHSPTVSEVAGHLGFSTENVLDGLEIAQARAAIPLDAPRRSDDNGAGSSTDFLGGPDPRLALADNTATVSRAVERLPQRERRILHFRFVEDLTQAEIAVRIGISQMHVSRLLRRSVQQLAPALAEVVQPLD
jgi:RNA polymerase sigma-B factor